MLQDTEVLFLYQPVDEFVMRHLEEYKGKKLVSIEAGDVDDAFKKTDAMGKTLLLLADSSAGFTFVFVPQEKNRRKRSRVFRSGFRRLLVSKWRR